MVSVGQDQELPSARLSWLQNEPTAAEPINRASGVGESIFKRGQKMPRRGVGEVIHSRGNTKVRGGGGVPWQSRYPVQPVEDPILQQMDIPKRTGLWSIHAGAGKKCKKEGAAERKCCVLTLTQLLPTHCTSVALLQRLSVTCVDSKAGGEESVVKE